MCNLINEYKVALFYSVNEYLNKATCDINGYLIDMDCLSEIANLFKVDSIDLQRVVSELKYFDGLVEDTINYVINRYQGGYLNFGKL